MCASWPKVESRKETGQEEVICEKVHIYFHNVINCILHSFETVHTCTLSIQFGKRADGSICVGYTN